MSLHTKKQLRFPHPVEVTGKGYHAVFGINHAGDTHADAFYLIGGKPRFIQKFIGKACQVTDDIFGVGGNAVEYQQLAVLVHDTALDKGAAYIKTDVIFHIDHPISLIIVLILRIYRGFYIQWC